MDFAVRSSLLLYPCFSLDSERLGHICCLDPEEDIWKLYRMGKLLLTAEQSIPLLGVSLHWNESLDDGSDTRWSPERICFWHIPNKTDYFTIDWWSARLAVSAYFVQCSLNFLRLQLTTVAGLTKYKASSQPAHIWESNDQKIRSVCLILGFLSFLLYTFNWCRRAAFSIWMDIRFRKKDKQIWVW